MIDTFWVASGAVISRILGLVASVITARMLGSEMFGELGIIRSTINVFITFAGFGLAQTATKFVAEYIHSDSDRVGRIINLSIILSFIIGLLISFALFFFSKSMARDVLNAEHLETGLKIGSIVIFCTGVSGIQNGIISGFQEFKKLSLRQSLLIMTQYVWVDGIC